MKQKLTHWYPGEIKPVRIGFYERMYHRGQAYFCWWDGAQFGLASEVPSGRKVILNTILISPHQNLPWRGMAK